MNELTKEVLKEALNDVNDVAIILDTRWWLSPKKCKICSSKLFGIFQFLNYVLEHLDET